MLEQVSSVTPLPIKRREHQVEKLEQTYSAEEATETDIPGTNTDPEQAEKVLKQIDLSGLTYDQKLAAQALIREEAMSFSTEDGDIGNILDTTMKIKLKDDVPVQRNYNGVPRPLYQEIKAYIEDLLNKQWIVESDSDYSSPVVAVRKKDNTIRLCCDYRLLNAKTVPDKHPLPRIQDTLDSLGETNTSVCLIRGKLITRCIWIRRADTSLHSSPLGGCMSGCVCHLV